MKQLSLILSIFFFATTNAQELSEKQTQSYTDTLQIFYDIDSFQVDEAQQQSITEWMNRVSDSIVSMSIFAYCDYLASAEYNQILSQKRAEQVHTFLNTTKKSDISLLMLPKGQILGKHQTEALGNSKNRRVDLIMTCIKPEEQIVIKTPPVNETSALIQKLEVGDHFVVKGLNFIGGQHFLTQASKPKLKKLLTALEESPNIHIEIQGHICCQDTGDGMDNYTGLQNLSVARAQYVYDYLIENGIDEHRLSYKGFGSSKKLFPEERNSFQQQRNRRVEILITGK